MNVEIVCLGDTHFPFHHKSALSYALAFIEKHKPKYVIQLGDLYDFYSLSRFPRSHAIPPHIEVQDARECAEDMWRLVKKFSPKSKCIQLMGNHDARLKSRIMERLPEILDIVRFEQLFKFRGVKTILSDREEHMVNNIAFMHGYRSGTPERAPHAKANLHSTVCGHSHRGGVTFVAVKLEKMIYEMNAGFLADPKSAALSYTKQKWTNWTLGFGVIDEYGPRFIPFKKKRK